MLAVAAAIESAGGSVRMAGGGAGSAFVALSGYDEFEPTTVDFIHTYQGGSVWRAARRSLPASLRRIADYQAWLSETEPDALVTDDMFAAMAATRCDVPLYVLKHDMPRLYDDFAERAGARFHTPFQLSAASEFFHPVVWPASEVDPAPATRIPPAALEGEQSVEDAPDVVVPSHYSSLSRVAAHLRRQGYDVCNVADEDWSPVESLLPYIRRADAVVCSGYSTIVDAAVAGTPCVVHPSTDEQDAVADCIEQFDVGGFASAFPAEPTSGSHGCRTTSDTPSPRAQVPNFASRNRERAAAPSRWVVREGSSRGATSTRSIAHTDSQSPSRSIAASSWFTSRPPNSGVPVPGATVGSTTSMSTVT